MKNDRFALLILNDENVTVCELFKHFPFKKKSIGDLSDLVLKFHEEIAPQKNAFEDTFKFDFREIV